MTPSSIPKGTRDFSPVQMSKRNYLFGVLREVFQLYGYQPIETPALENLSTLMGKYGEEGDKLLFKVLNSGEWRTDLTPDLTLGQATNKVCEKGLRYDLTVPFARYVVQHRQDITFPFRRYQMQPVWRADRPQHGRYREFYQCDVDIIGTDTLVAEVELIAIIRAVFERLKIDVTIHLNNRKILAGIAEYIGFPDQLVDLTVAIDKMEKIGFEKVQEELLSKGFTPQAIDKLRPILELQGSNSEQLDTLEQLLPGNKGISELRQVFEGCGKRADLQLDLALARGLNYYTGAIMEVKANDVVMGSITGGGRYDNLTGIFGMPNVSGVGISFGADRIYDVLEEKKAFPDDVMQTVDLLIVAMGETELLYGMTCAEQLRQRGLRVEVYPDVAKLKKLLTYANSRGISRVAIIGEEEVAKQVLTIKDMVSGEQKQCGIELV